MITERRFSSAYSSMWRELIPSADAFVRNMNLVSQRVFPPYTGWAAPALNGAVNETAFRVLCRARQLQCQVRDISGSDLSTIWEEVCRWLNNLPSGEFKLTEKVGADVYEISVNMARMVGAVSAEDGIFEPEFPGCGLISACRGDVQIGGALLEFKAGDRKFRSIDLRQVLVYCALARKAGKPIFEEVCLANPRSGTMWRGTLMEVAQGCGAVSAVELLDEIVDCAVLLGSSS